MENRFGVKDLFLLILLVVVIIMLALMMKQFDRQYQLVRDLQEKSQDQLHELVAIHSDLQHGGGFAATTNPSNAFTDQGPDPFAALRKLRNDGKYDEGDWLVQNLHSPIAKLTPLLVTDLYGYVINAQVVETLVYQDTQTLNFVPLLATSWTTTDNSKAWQAYVDRRVKEGGRLEDVESEADCPPAAVIDFQLRRGVTFSDGSPFSADDVVFTFDWIRDPKIDAPRDRQGFEKLKTVTKVNDYEVSFSFKEPYYMAFANVAGEGILSKNFYSAYTPEQFNNSVGLLIGTGPYRLSSPTSWKPAPGKIELVRNERYWGLAPSFDRLVYFQVESDAASLVMYGNGELDLEVFTPQQYKLELANQAVMEHSNSYVYPSPLAGYFFIGWNQLRKGKQTLFADKRIRQAMTMLTDRQGICDNIYLGYADPATGPFHPLTKQHDPTLVDWKYDPDKAKAILKEAGFEDRGKGVLERADGTTFSFTLTYPSKNETVDRVMQYIKDNYARAGVNMTLDPVDWTIIDQRAKSRDFDALFMGWGGGSMESDIYQMFDSSQIQDQGDNFVSYSDPAFETALNQARCTLDESRRMDIWHQCERILHEDQPYTFVMVPKALVLADKRIANIRLGKTGSNYVQFWPMPIPWYVPQSEQKYKN